MKIRVNALETKRFGVTCAQICDASTAALDLQSVNRQAAQQDVSMLSVRVDASSLKQVHAFEADGYRLMDTLVYYGGPARTISACDIPSEDAELRMARNSDFSEIAEVARLAFRDYFGHYHADPRLDNRAADAAYVQWAETSLMNQTDDNFVAVAAIQNKVRGFITTRRSEDTGVEIVLNAVHPDFQGRGLYSRLLGFVGTSAVASGLDSVTVSTQLQNYAVQRVWARSGLVLEHSLYTLHKWFD